MTCVKRKAQGKTVRGWREAGALLERWRKDLKTLTVEVKQPRVIDLVPIDFVSEEPVEREGKPAKRLRGQLIYFTNADLTIRRPSGAILVIDRYEVSSISESKITTPTLGWLEESVHFHKVSRAEGPKRTDGKMRFEPH